MPWLLRRPATAEPDPVETSEIDGVTLAEIEAERAGFLRRRLIWCATVFVALLAMSMGGQITDPDTYEVHVREDRPALRAFAAFAISGVTESAALFALSIGVLLFAIFARPSTARALAGVSTLIVGIQAIVIARYIALAIFSPSNSLQLLVQESALALLLTFAIACIIMPWSPREALRPVIPCVVMHQAALLAMGRWEPLAQAAALLLIVCAALPGVAYTLLRWRPGDDIAQLRVRSRRYSSLARDLFDARRIHESIFPAAIESGPVRLVYRYRPSQHIGGDFLYVRRLGDGPEAPLVVAVVDVTGHGVASALTVNRLHAEIERTLQERPGTTPGELLHRLNDYLHYTLAIHSVYATAVCLRIDPPTDEGASHVRWASGGHPPMLLRHADGSIECLWSTAFMLGVVSGPDYQADERETTLTPGEVLLLYTDGAIDTPTPGGAMLEIEGVESLFLKALGDAEAIAAHIDRAISGMQSDHPTDDTLFVVVTRPSAPRIDAREEVPGGPADDASR